MPPEPAPAPPTAVEVPPGPPPELSDLELVPEPPSVPSHQAAADAQKTGARPGAQQIGVRNVKVVALDGNIVVVLEAENDGIGQAQVNLAIVNQARPDAGSWS